MKRRQFLHHLSNSMLLPTIGGLAPWTIAHANETAASASPAGLAGFTYTLDIRGDSAEPVPPSPIKVGTSIDAQGNTFAFNSRYFLKNGKPWLPVQGEMQFSRTARTDWEDEILKMKAGGIDIIASYVFWIHHEEIEGQFDWGGDRSLRDFLALARKHDMQVLLRIGPWCHGEVRNGGFPDWLLQGHGELRSDDPLFLAATQRLFAEIGAQSQGQLFKDGGPVIGIQLENEFVFTEERPAKYMYALKRIAIESGFDVPIYTQFSWPGGPPGQTEFLPMRGAYPDAPWTQHTNRLVRDDRYRFGPVTFDPFVGNDLFGMRSGDSGAPQPFPLATAELGSGLHATYHRRPVLSASDVVAMAYANIGSGTNLIGYYVFHGGSNPDGKLTTLEETRATQYPNDVAIITYDFQAPIGEYGQTRESYREYRLLHLFLRNFGPQLALTAPFFPATDPKADPEAIPPMRYSARAKDGKGFVFVNNYRRYLASPTLTDVQVSLQSAQGTLLIPDTPVTVPPDVYFAWPFNLDLQGALLRYATAQPLGRFGEGDAGTHVFCATAGIVPRYRFAGDGIAQVIAANGTTLQKRDDGDYEIRIDAPGTAAVFTVETQAGALLRVLTLTRAQALTATQIDIAGKPHLLLSQADVLPGIDTLRLRQTGEAEFGWSLFPDHRFTHLAGIKRSRDGIFTRYSGRVPSKSVQIGTQKIGEATAMSADVAARPQPGLLYGSRYAEVPGSSTWQLSVPDDALAGVQDLLLDVDYTGDTAALYRDGKLVADNINSGQTMRIGLRRTIGRVAAGEWRLQIVPLTRARDIAFEDPAIQQRGLVASLTRVNARPVYELELAL